MSRSSIDIHDVEMHTCVYSRTGEIGTSGLSPCVAVIIIFSDRSVILEHRSDLELCKNGNRIEALCLLEDISKNIISMKKIHLNIRHVFIIGGCVDNVKEKFQRSLMSVCKEYRNEKPHASDDLCVRIMSDLCQCLKILNISWSTKENQDYDDNECFIDILVAGAINNQSCLYIRQGVSLLNKTTQEATKVYCGYFSYKFFDDNHAGIQQNNSSLNNATFYMNNDLAESYRSAVNDYKIIRDSLFKFIENVARLGAQSTKANNGTVFTRLINIIFERLVRRSTPDITIQALRTLF